MADPEKTIHDLEQFTQALLNIAVVLAEYYRKLLAEGFTEEQAFGLVVNCQDVLFQRTGRNDV